MMIKSKKIKNEEISQKAEEAEKERIAQILDLPEAARNQETARNLAFRTRVSPSEAAEILRHGSFNSNSDESQKSECDDARPLVQFARKIGLYGFGLGRGEENHRRN